MPAKGVCENRKNQVQVRNSLNGKLVSEIAIENLRNA
jgi:hypothetical protein